jgi:hypothetical protein
VADLLVFQDDSLLELQDGSLLEIGLALIPDPDAVGPFFAGSYFIATGGLAGPGYPSSILYDSQGGFYPGRYFPASYFAPTYFPARPVDPIAFPTSFLSALRQIIRDDAVLMSLMPGDWWNREIPPGQDEPVGLYVVQDSPDERIGGKKFIREGTLRMTVYGPDATEAGRLADRVARILADAPLVWIGGRMMYFSMEDPASPSPAVQGIAGSMTTGETRMFHFQYHGSY